MLRYVLVVVVLAAALASPAAAIAPPHVEEEGSWGWACRWDPFAEIACDGPDCWWVGRWMWFDLFGNSLGVRCA